MGAHGLIDLIFATFDLEPGDLQVLLQLHVRFPHHCLHLVKTLLLKGLQVGALITDEAAADIRLGDAHHEDE